MKWFLLSLLRGGKALPRHGARPARRPAGFQPEFTVLEDREVRSVMTPSPLLNAVPPQRQHFSLGQIGAVHSHAEMHRVVSALPAGEVVGALLPVSNHAAHQVPVVDASLIAQVFGGPWLNHDLDGLGQGKLINQTGFQPQNPFMPAGDSGTQGQQETGSLFGSAPVRFGPVSGVGFLGNSGEGGDEGTGIPGFGSASGLAGLNQALNREGLPGLTLPTGFAAEGSDDASVLKFQDSNGHADFIVIPGGQDYNGMVFDIPADGKKGSVFQTGGAVEVKDNSTLTIYGYGNGKQRTYSVSWPRGANWRPNPADDGTTSGPGKAPVDGTGNLPPIGGKVDGENKLQATMKGQAVKGSQFAILAHLYQRSALGTGSGQGVVDMQGHINPNPEGGDNNNLEDASYLKTIRFQSDGVLDPIPSPMREARLRLRG
jgi:hypothetical protein